jgi:large subunit ribosomal protein L31
MKKGIHPNLQKATVKCACGNTFETLSVREKISVEICAKCHPVFTGKEKRLDSTGQVEKYEKRYGKKTA